MVLRHMAIPPLDLKLLEDPEYKEIEVVEEKYAPPLRRHYPRWLPAEDFFGPGENEEDLWVVFDEGQVSYAYAPKFDIRDIEEIGGQEWIRTPLFTQDQYEQAAYLEDVSDLAFLYHRAAAASGRRRHRYSGANEYRAHWYQYYAKSYTELDKRFLPVLKHIDVFGPALIVPFDIAI